jgi:Ca2+-binding EF-hand superfamily protein
MTPHEIEVLKEQFLAYAKSQNDETGATEMTEADFWQWVNGHSTLNPQQQTREFLTVLFQLADSNKNAKISFNEFLLFVCRATSSC